MVEHHMENNIAFIDTCIISQALQDDEVMLKLSPFIVNKINFGKNVHVSITALDYSNGELEKFAFKKVKFNQSFKGISSIHKFLSQQINGVKKKVKDLENTYEEQNTGKQEART
jgi:hypothetical protein